MQLVTVNNLGGDFRGVPGSKIVNDNFIGGIGAPTAPPVEPDKAWVYIDTLDSIITHYWDAVVGVWVSLSASEVSFTGDTKTAFRDDDHGGGWVKADGRSLTTLSPIQQTKAAAIGFTSNLPQIDSGDSTTTVVSLTVGGAALISLTTITRRSSITYLIEELNATTGNESLTFPIPFLTKPNVTESVNMTLLSQLSQTRAISVFVTNTEVSWRTSGNSSIPAFLRVEGPTAINPLIGNIFIYLGG